MTVLGFGGIFKGCGFKQANQKAEIFKSVEYVAYFTGLCGFGGGCGDWGYKWFLRGEIEGL